MVFLLPYFLLEDHNLCLFTLLRRRSLLGYYYYFSTCLTGARTGFALATSPLTLRKQCDGPRQSASQEFSEEQMSETDSVPKQTAFTQELEAHLVLSSKRRTLAFLWWREAQELPTFELQFPPWWGLSSFWEPRQERQCRGGGPL